MKSQVATWSIQILMVANVCCASPDILMVNFEDSECREPVEEVLVPIGVCTAVVDGQWMLASFSLSPEGQDHHSVPLVVRTLWEDDQCTNQSRLLPQTPPLALDTCYSNQEAGSFIVRTFTNRPILISWMELPVMGFALALLAPLTCAVWICRTCASSNVSRRSAVKIGGSVVVPGEMLEADVSDAELKLQPNNPA